MKHCNAFLFCSREMCCFECSVHLELCCGLCEPSADVGSVSDDSEGDEGKESFALNDVQNVLASKARAVEAESMFPFRGIACSRSRLSFWWLRCESSFRSRYLSRAEHRVRCGRDFYFCSVLVLLISHTLTTFETPRRLHFLFVILYSVTKERACHRAPFPLTATWLLDAHVGTRSSYRVVRCATHEGLRHR